MNDGMVILAGAGPGDPGLLTLAAKDAIDNAEVILHDRLAGGDILAMLPREAVKIDVGKTDGNHPVPQDEINRLLVRYAKEGKRVVRLKGGDPFVFGRGGEELEYLVRHSITFRVVPGVTSAVAAPACAGIPVTHRDLSSSLHILTGHGKDGHPAKIPYQALVDGGGTLVFLMALSAVAEVCDKLSACGMAPSTPAALVENGTRSNQRTVAGTLASLPDLALQEAVVSPAILIVGDVCLLAATLGRMERRPLQGKRILVVSSQTTGARLAALLAGHGCQVEEFAAIRTEPPNNAERAEVSPEKYAWIVFTSPAGVDLFFAGLFAKGLDARSLANARFAVIGSRTARVLRNYGILPDYMPGRYDGAALGAGLAGVVRTGEPVLLYRAEAGGDELPDALRAGGVAFDDFPAYATVRIRPPGSLAERVRGGSFDAVTFTSASAADVFGEAFEDMDFAEMRAFCIGEKTASAAREFGFHIITSKEATLESMASIVVETMEATA